MHNYAKELLRTFIVHSEAIYGEKFIVYNVHSLFHLAEECAEHGELDSFSAFCFENRLKSKNLFDLFANHLNKLLSEIWKKTVRSVHLSYNGNNIILSQRHIDPMETVPGIQYKKIIVNNITFKLGQQDSCVKTSDGSVMIITNIIRRNDNSVYIMGHKFHQYEDYYDYPLPSSKLGIVKVSRLSATKNVIELSKIQAKCWLIHIPHSESYLSMPLLHTFITH